MADETLLDRWLAKAKNHRGVAAVCLVTAALGGLTSFTDSLEKIRIFFSEKEPTPVIQPPLKPEPPPAKRISFREEFALGERDTFVSNHGVTVTTDFIMSLEGQGLVADVGASAKGRVTYLQRVHKGEQIELYRQDCDSLMVVVKDIQFTWPKGITENQLLKMGPAAEALVTRKVIGWVAGKCEE